MHRPVNTSKPIVIQRYLKLRSRRRWFSLQVQPCKRRFLNLLSPSRKHGRHSSPMDLGSESLRTTVSKLAEFCNRDRMLKLNRHPQCSNRCPTIATDFLILNCSRRWRCKTVSVEPGPSSQNKIKRIRKSCTIWFNFYRRQRLAQRRSHVKSPHSCLQSMLE